MTAIIAAVVAAFVAMVGWFVGHLLVSLREDRTRRLQLTIEHAERQIGEFYAPLLGLLEQLDTVFRVKEAMVAQEPQHQKIIAKIAYTEYFLPLHQEIRGILKSKIHLFEGVQIPDSFIEYIHHFTSESIYWRLTEEEGIASSVTVSAFPSRFYDDLKRDLDVVLARYERSVQELRRGILPLKDWLAPEK